VVQIERVEFKAARSGSSAAFGNQAHYAFIDPILVVELLPPRQRRYVVVFVYGFILDKAQTLSQRCASIGIGPMVQ
jgi:hypothetical protein